MKSTHASGRAGAPVRPGRSPHRPGHRTRRSGHFLHLDLGQFGDLALLAFSLASVVLGIAPRGEIAAEPHRDRACGDLGQACSDDDAVESTAPESPAAKAKGTVRPSDIPMTRSRMTSLPVKCRSTCGVSGECRPPPLSDVPFGAGSVADRGLLFCPEKPWKAEDPRSHHTPEVPGWPAHGQHGLPLRTSAHPIPASQPGLHRLGQQDITSNVTAGRASRGAAGVNPSAGPRGE